MARTTPEKATPTAPAIAPKKISNLSLTGNLCLNCPIKYAMSAPPPSMTQFTPMTQLQEKCINKHSPSKKDTIHPKDSNPAKTKKKCLQDNTKHYCRKCPR